mgnify:CR=1 FL=1
MPWRLIGFILLLALFLAFIALNLDHRTDISFGFLTVTNVPVFLSLFGAFVVGVLVALPLTARAKTRGFKKRLKKQSTDASSSPKKKRGGRRRREDSAEEKAPEK